MKRTLVFFLLFISLIFFFASCDKNRIYDDNQELPESGWQATDIKKFEVEIKDPATPANFYINVRNAEGFPFRDIFMFIKTTFPNGKYSVDTLDCILADEKGHWLGKGLGDIYDNQIPFKKNVRFPMAGKYTFELQHAMRIDPVLLIMDVGLRIEKSEN